MKKSIVKFGLRDCQRMWIYLWEISKNLKFSFLRPALYKMSIAKGLSENIYLINLLANCYLQTGNYDLSFKYLKELKHEHNVNNPLIHLQLGLNHLFKSMSRLNMTKEISILSSNESMTNYSHLRLPVDYKEVMFNMGRYYQFIGYDKLAYSKYDELLSSMLNTCMEDAEYMNKLYRSVNYNYLLLLKKSGNDEEAHRMIMNNIII
jgi:general transcription factor 3C polypeptide 3 (transcription factor C subunit 4)